MDQVDKKEFSKARNKAFKLLSYRERTIKEIEDRLSKKDFEADVIKAVVDFLLEKDYLNEERFAEMWIRSRIRRKAEGLRKLKAALKQKGVDDRVADDALSQEFDKQMQQEALEAATEKMLVKSQGDRDKFIRMLLGRGFSWKQINNYSINKFFQYYDELR